MAAPPCPPSQDPPGQGTEWFFVGLASSYPDITDSSEPYFKLAWPQPRHHQGQEGRGGRGGGGGGGDDDDDDTTPSRLSSVPGCKVFHPKQHQPLQEEGGGGGGGGRRCPVVSAEEIDLDAAAGEDAWVMREQVLVFRYKGRFHAVDHACPHRAYSLSWGRPFDIEDAGRVLGRGIRCRGHSYAFELSTGIGDRGDYRLGVWDVELRPCGAGAGADGGGGGGGGGGDNDGETGEEREVWVRRREGRTES